MDGGIRVYLKLIRRWWWLLVVSAVVPMILSYCFASQQPDMYQAQATVMVGGSVFQDPDPDPRQLSLGNTLAAAYAELLRQGPVTGAVIERLGLNLTPEQLSEQIGTRIYSGAQLLVIEVTDTNPETAALIANALADELIRRSPTSEDRDPEQQEFVREQLEELQVKIENVGQEINDLTRSLAELTSAAEIQEAQERIEALEEVSALYQSTYASLLDVYRAESPNTLSLFDPAAVPQWPMPSKTRSVVAVSAAAGLGLALCAILLMEFLDTSLRWEDRGVRSVLDLPVLGTIPRISRKEVSFLRNASNPALESAYAVWVAVGMHHDRSFRTVLFTSPDDSDGKSFVLASLAVMLARAGRRVIVVDANLRRPSLHECFEQPNLVGLADVLGDPGFDCENPALIPLKKTALDNLSLLPAGRPSVDPTVLLASPNLPALMRSLGECGDILLVDSSPVLGSADATFLAKVTEGTIMVVSAGLTRCDLIQQARDYLLTQRGVKVLGVVVNRVRLSKDNRYLSDSSAWRSGKTRKGEDDSSVWVTLAEAAGLLGVSEDLARRWCMDGRLPAMRRGFRWWVNFNGLPRVLEDTPEPGARERITTP